MKKILTIGGATQDIFLEFDQIQTISTNNQNYFLLEEGSKVDLKGLSYFTGGGATNTAVSFKRLGFNVSTIIKIGKDNAGDFVVNELKKEEIDISNILYSDLPTAISFIFPFPSGDRTVLAYRSTNKDLKKEEISLDIIKAFDQIYIAPLSGESGKILFEVTEFAKKNNIKVAVNPNIHQIKLNGENNTVDDFLKSLKNIDILILNSSEAKVLFETFTKKNQIFNLERFFKIILICGTKIIAVTDGVNGVHVAYENKIYFHPSIKPEKIVNTLGAGDAFASTFVATILDGKSIKEALLFGIINSSSVISKKGSQTGLLTYNTLQEKAKSLSKGLIKILF